MPVKGWRIAKSRLRELPDGQRADLARALAHDTVQTVIATPEVAECLIVGEADTCAELAHYGARLVQADDRDGLGPAVRHGVNAVRSNCQSICVLVADLPLLTSAALADALHAVPTHGHAVVRDEAGTGSVLLATRDGDLRPAFGPDSARLHLEGGAADLSEVASATLRRDLDVWSDLGAVDPRPDTWLARWYSRRMAVVY